MSDNDTGITEEIEEGAPMWVVTFGDLMSLLMCFFVLLLSFAEMDVRAARQWREPSGVGESHAE